MDSDPAFATELRRRLHVFCDAIMLVADRADRIRFVLNPATGEPVLPVHADVLEHDELTLLVPDESNDALQLLCTPAPINPASADACDRHQIFFGKPHFPKWALLEIEAVKSTQGVLEGAVFIGPEPLHAFEPALLKLLNTDRALLGAACQRLTGTAPDEPLAVGVDEWGAWVRARFGAMRLPFTMHAPSDAAARAAIASLLHGSPS